MKSTQKKNIKKRASIYLVVKIKRNGKCLTENSVIWWYPFVLESKPLGQRVTIAVLLGKFPKRRNEPLTRPRRFSIWLFGYLAIWVSGHLAIPLEPSIPSRTQPHSIQRTCLVIDWKTVQLDNWTTEKPLRSFHRLTHTSASNRTCLSPLGWAPLQTGPSILVLLPATGRWRRFLNKNSQTDEEKQRDRQRNEREAKKEEQDAINYKRDKEQREARLLDFEIRRQQKRDEQQQQRQQQQQLQQHREQQHQQHQQQREHLQQQHRDQQQSSEKSPPTSSSAAAAHQTHPHSQQQQQRQHLHLQQQHLQQQQQQQQQQSTGSGSSNTPVTPKLQTPPPDRSLPPAFRSRSIEREIFYERKRFSQPETGEIKELDSTTSSSSTQQTFPGSAVGAGRAAAAAVPGSGTAVAVAVAGAGAGQSATLAGPPATAAAATAAIIPILPLGVATLRDDSTESEQSVTCAHNQLDAYHRIIFIDKAKIPCPAMHKSKIVRGSHCPTLKSFVQNQ
ncbi:mediator of RNA polymerase II transcription subunit 15 isoform X2 [Drosophila simulans]|uniref:mediator of RNA polymerase II transcription subunit 15 isoform X2 n=1 Tax=Drosophila simulans TaxID=7240 RepID=UPI00192D193D|nr:mediator of RNA polymerase II transcription subunit 15 isoform X2 [Drosophila simulans]